MLKSLPAQPAQNVQHLLSIAPKPTYQAVLVGISPTLVWESRSYQLIRYVMSKRCSERDLKYTSTTIILPDSTAAEGVIADESLTGCGVRLKGQYEIEEGMNVCVLIGTVLHSAIVRHVNPNIDGPILGLEFLFGNETKLEKSNASTDAKSP